MSAPDELPTLAELRLRRGVTRPGTRKISKAPQEAVSSLFDLFPAPGAFAGEQAELPVTERAAEPPPSQAPPKASSTQTELSAGTMVPIEEPRVWTVAALVRQVRGLVEEGFSSPVTVEGEISNWRPGSSGHCYFTLKGGNAQLSVVMFRAQALRLKFRPKDGDAVRMRGQLSVYENRGQMQLVAAAMDLAGLGAQLAAVQELKARLRQEGLFDHKRTLPPFPKCIGVITSLQGAALRDIVKVCRRRHAAVNLLVYPAAVQGPRCPAEVIAGLRWFNAHPDQVDVVLVARGGGSWEDLHGFDDEGVARAIASSAVPVVVGVGHATDSTVADAAADVCAPTPSAAAELVTPAQHKVEEHVLRLRARVMRAGSFELLQAHQRLLRIGGEPALRRVRESVTQRMQQVDELGFRLESAAVKALRSQAETLRALKTRLHARHVGRQFPELVRRHDALRVRLGSAAAAALSRRRTRNEALTLQLAALSPLRVLERGYALVYTEDGSLLRAAAETRPGDSIRARLAVGSLLARVESVETERKSDFPFKRTE